MKKFEGILICTDLDGTLLKNDKSVSKENIDAINYFKENGGLLQKNGPILQLCYIPGKTIDGKQIIR